MYDNNLESYIYFSVHTDVHVGIHKSYTLINISFEGTPSGCVKLERKRFHLLFINVKCAYYSQRDEADRVASSNMMTTRGKTRTGFGSSVVRALFYRVVLHLFI